MKSTFIVLRQFTEQWLGSQPVQVSGGSGVPYEAKQMLSCLLLGEGTSIMLQTCIRHGYDPGDAASTVSMHKEICHFQRTCVQCLGPHYVETFTEQFLGPKLLNLSATVIQSYVVFLTDVTTSVKQFRKFISSLMGSLHQRSMSGGR